MPTLPPSLAELLDCFRPCFTAPTFQALCALTTGFLAQTGPRTITGILAGARLAGRYPDRSVHLVADAAYAGRCASCPRA